MNRKDEIIKLTKELMAIPSISDSDHELLVSDYITKWFQGIPFFREHPEYTGAYHIPGDYRNRDVAYAYVPGAGKKTMVLMGHFDVVSVADFGEGADVAFSADEVTGYLEKCELDEDVRSDLKSGEWMFGRGCGDMKGGLAAAMVFVKEYTKRKERPGSLLLVAVPDEESYSAGMRGAGGLMKELKEKYNLEYELLVDPEPNARQGNQHIVPVGSAGKCMPVLLVQGAVSHVSKCFEGLNPMGIMGEIFNRTELSLEFSDISDGEISCPPTWLWMKDMKEEYDVSVPHRVSGYISMISYESTPEDVLEKLIPICRESFETYVKKMQRIYQEYQKLSKYPSEYEIAWEPRVMTLAELCFYLESEKGDTYRKFYKELYKETAEKIQSGILNYPQATIHMMDSLLTFSGITKPLVLLGFTPPYYPAVRSDHVKGKEKTADRCLMAAGRKMEEKYGVSYVKENYTLGLSDLSYCSIDKEFDYVKYSQNTPLWGDLYKIDFEVISQIDVPSVLAGPWSKDLHKKTERVHIKSLSEEYPEFLEAISEEVWRE